MKTCDEQTEHDGWVRQEIESALAEAADPAVERVAHDDVAAEVVTVLRVLHGRQRWP